MADKTKIEWADASVNPIRARDHETGKIGWHCEHATPGCEFCYAETLNHRLGTGHPFIPQAHDKVDIFLDDHLLTEPLRWRRPRRIFWNSMTDAFADFVTDEMLDRQFAVAALAPQHEHLFLTKRAERLKSYSGDPETPKRIVDALANLTELKPSESLNHSINKALCGVEALANWPLPNVMFGVSVEDQRRADERRESLRVPAEAGWRTFVSYEPALGPVDWTGWEFLSWVISGGESGPDARPSHPDWHRATRDFCRARAIPYLFKQWGQWLPDRQSFDPTPYANAKTAHNFGDVIACRVGKHAAGRFLDGVEHSEFPA